MKIEAPPVLLAKLRLYAEPFHDRRPPVFAHFPGGADPVFPFGPASDRGLGVLLLAAALHRPEGEAQAARVVAGLYRHYGNDIFKLNRVPFDPLRETLAALVPPASAGADASERTRMPGILRSVCDFFYRVGPLGAWLAAAPDWETRAGELCHEIYWMGLHSRSRSKARLFFWLASLAREGAGETAFSQAAAFAWPVGDGHMRFWIDILKPGRTAGARVPEDRVAAFAAFAGEVFPDAPWRLYQPLDAFLHRDGRGGYACRAVQGGCRPCPLAVHCPAAPHFLAGETLPAGQPVARARQPREG
jgi:hypothetical protein